ncbi:MAG: class I SAM-dependent methyltransferase [Candidatus Thorarchaeota archaeon]
MDDKTIDYDQVSKIYDKVRVGDPEMIRQILDGVSLSSDSIVLDIGCGTGNNTLLLAATTSSQVIGLDLSIGMLREASPKSLLLPLVQSPANILPFCDESFEFVFMTEVAHHLPDVNTTLSEIFRILRTCGSFCLVTQSHRQIEGRMTSRFFPATIEVDQARYPDIDVLEESMRAAGFHQVDSREHIFRPVRLGTDYLITVSKRGYSMLHKISDDDYNRGLNALRKAYKQGEELTYSAGYTFMWGFKR